MTSLVDLPAKALLKVLNLLSDADVKSLRLCCTQLRDAGAQKLTTVRIAALLSLQQTSVTDLVRLPALTGLDYRFGHDAHIAEVVALVHKHRALQQASALKLSGRNGLKSAISVFRACCPNITSLSISCQHRFKHHSRECRELTSCLSIIEGA